MWIKARLKDNTDMLAVYHDLFGFKYVNISDENTVYFYGEPTTGELVKNYLGPLAEDIFVQEED